MSSFADLKANIVTASDSLSVNNGTNSITINPTTISGTNLVVSNANLSGTTTCGQSLLPSYSYPVSAGRIGEIITGTTTTLAYTNLNSPVQIASISLTKGVWIITSNVKTNPFNINGYAIQFISLTSSTGNVTVSNLICSPGNTIQSTISAPISINSTTTYYVYYQSNQTGPIVEVTFNAVRIA